MGSPASNSSSAALPCSGGNYQAFDLRPGKNINFAQIGRLGSLPKDRSHCVFFFFFESFKFKILRFRYNYDMQVPSFARIDDLKVDWHSLEGLDAQCWEEDIHWRYKELITVGK